MLRRHAALSLALAAGIAVALAHAPSRAAPGTIYRTTQPDGTVVFTDRPEPDAVVVAPGPINVVGAGDVEGRGATAPDVPAPDVPANALATPTPALGSALPGAAPPDLPEPAFPSPVPTGTGLPAGSVERVEIASPPPDATLLDPVGPLLVEIGTAPGSLAASGLLAEVLVDGEVVATGESSQLSVPPPERGEHRLQVRLTDVDGSVVVESAAQALHVRRTVVAEGDGGRD